MFVDGVPLAEVLTLGDQERVVRILFALRDVKTRGESVQLQNRLVQILTKVEKPRRRHRQKLNDFFAAWGFIGGDEEKKAPATLDTLSQVKSWFAAQLGTTPNEFATNTNSGDVQALYKEITKKKIEAWLMSALSYHDPKTLQEHIRRLRGEVDDKTKMELKERSPSRLVRFIAEDAPSAF